MNSYYRNQMPHYVLAKSKGSSQSIRRSDPNDSFQDVSASSIVDHVKSKPKSGGILQDLIDTARDDLTLVGNVIKLALS